MSTIANNPDSEFIRFFAPEVWSPAKMLATFAGAPLSNPNRLARAARAADNRRSKFRALADVLNLLRPSLASDILELDQRGYSPTHNSRRYAAVAETLFLELYSAVDAAREAIYFAFVGVPGVQKGSNLALFKRAHESTYGPDFPERLREILASAYESWFLELREIRNEVSHGDIGTCHLSESSAVTYMHGGLGSGGRALVVKDLEQRLVESANNVFGLVDQVFDYLCEQLGDETRRVTCGIYKARLYERDVAFAKDLNRNSGTCHSRVWFEDQPDLKCPIREECEAYER